MIGSATYNPGIERIRREQLHYGEPEDEEICDVCGCDPCECNECPVCGFDPCRCDEVDAVADGLKQMDVKITEGGES